MASIQPISTSRVTDAMTRGRLTQQIQGDQLELFRLQNQLSTGFRIFLPSDDASAAQRAMVLQRTIERKEQANTNLLGASSALATADSVLADMSNQLNTIRAAGLSAVDGFASETERTELIGQIDGLIDNFARVGNSTFTGTYLFGGTETSSSPYGQSDFYVEYTGDEGSPQTYVDIGYLFDSGTSGDSVLGGLSESVRGAIDIDAQLTPETRLKHINGGNGVTDDGAIKITFEPSSPSEPTTEAVIDLSRADTLADVARLIEQGAPAGTTLVAQVSGDGLRIEAADGGITISEVGEGRSALELGLPVDEPPAATVAGDDLNPTLRVTTPLDDLVGVRSRGRIDLGGPNNDLTIVAAQNGAAFNNLTVVLEDGATAGSESAVYDDLTNTLTVSISDNESTANQIADAINAEGAFAVAPDYRDAESLAQRGTGTVLASATPGDTYLNVTDAGGEDGSLDLASGLLVTNGAETYTIDTSGAETVEDLLNLFNRTEYGLAASINATGDGIDIRSRRSGADFTIAENGGTTAEDLGIRTYRGDSRLADFNRGVGVLMDPETVTDTAPQSETIQRANLLQQNEFTIEVTEDGTTTTYSIDPTEAQTVDDLIQQITDDTGGAVAASLKTVGNGLTLVVTDPDSPAAPASGSFALGLDTLEINADADGPDGNRAFTVEVLADGGGGPLSTGVVGDAITVDLGGAPATTVQIAQAIETALAGFTVTSDGGDTISTDQGPINAATTGGQFASDAALAASGGFTLNADPITFDAISTGSEGNTTFTVELVNTGVAGLEATVVDDVITVNLGGADSTTDAIADAINTQLPDYAVSAGGSVAVLQADVGTFTAPITGGQAVDSITVSGSYAQRLGFVPAGEDSVTSVEGGLSSVDTNPQEVDSVFTTLIRMREALENGDLESLGREVNRLDDDLKRVNFSRAEIGTRVRSLESVQTRLASEEIELRDALSREIDADLVEVISDYTLKQASLQASLQTSSSLLSLSILDFI